MVRSGPNSSSLDLGDNEKQGADARAACLDLGLGNREAEEGTACDLPRHGPAQSSALARASSSATRILAPRTTRSTRRERKQKWLADGSMKAKLHVQRRASIATPPRSLVEASSRGKNFLARRC